MFSESDENPDARLDSLGEVRVIERIRRAFAKVSPPAPRGMGDDCAVLPAVPAETAAGTRPLRLVTTDGVVFGRHFDESVSPRDAGRKLVRRNVSDVAAMGGTPSDAVLALVMSGDVSAERLDEFLRGVADACAETGVELSGGDVSSAPCGRFFSATLALTGFADRPLLRSGAEVGDALFVTGTLGGSLAKKHFDFRPRVAEGRFLASLPEGTVRACIDVTDGLLKDHAALLPAGTHAEFDFAALPVSDDARALGGDPIRRAFCDGEDYELLFAVAGTRADDFEKLWRERFSDVRLSRVARVAPGAENPALEAALGSARAYEHFLARASRTAG